MPNTPLVWYKSQVLWGVLISSVLKLAALVLHWKSPFSAAETTEIAQVVTSLASLVGDAIAAHGRITATAQPLTLSEDKHA